LIINLPEYFEKPSTSRAKKLLKIVDLAPDSENIKRELNSWLGSRLEELQDPASLEYRKNLADSYLQVKQELADLEPEVTEYEVKVKRIEYYIKSSNAPRNALIRKELKETKQQLKELKRKAKAYAKRAKDMPKQAEKDKKNYDALKKVVALVGGSYE
jgi:septal ring factor EnvC (AmiA/AmiB activator)